MGEQQNFYQLNKHYDTNESRYIPQRTDSWHAIRNTAFVTGSTCHKALGLGKLREQQQHFDHVIKKVEKTNFDIDTQRRMEYDTIHEIDAVATLTGNVLLFPNQTYIKNGCV